MEVLFRMSLPREAASVPIVRRLCRHTFHSLGVEEDCVGDLELVVTEACTNVLKHATNGDDEYVVEVRTTGETCDVRVKDAGRGFHPGPRALEAAHASAEGGRGLHLMRLLVDRLQFVSEGSGTVVHLRKSLRLRADSPLLMRHDGARRPSYTG
jgi:serine/threonine-protein kinase RsbW